MARGVALEGLVSGYTGLAMTGIFVIIALAGSFVPHCP
jgi:hypothetical protein